MYQIEVAGDDIRRLNKILAWTGNPGEKGPGHVRFVSNEKGVFLWVNTRFCEGLFKIHGPIGDYGVRQVFWGEWKRGFGKVKADNGVKIKVTKTKVTTQVGTVKQELHANLWDKEPGFEILDVSEIEGDRIYFNDETMSVSKIGFSAKTTAASLTPIVWKKNYLVTSSIFYSKSCSLVVPFQGNACFSQGFLRVPVEAGGGVTGFVKDEDLWLSAIDFTCRFKKYENHYSEQEVKDLLGAGNIVPFGRFPNFDKKTERNAYIRKINANNDVVSVGGITVEPSDNSLIVSVTCNGNSIRLFKADLVLALKHMASDICMSKSDNGDRVAAVFTDSKNDKIVVLAGIK